MDANNCLLSLAAHQTSAGTVAGMFLHRSRGNHASPSILSSGDNVGFILAKGYGSAFHDLGAILFQVDATPGANDMPGRIVFSTTPDGSAATSERFRISNFGGWGIGGATFGGVGDIFSSGGSAAPPTWVTRGTLNAALDHNLLSNLAVGDVHTQYALLAGRAGGQVLIGDTASAGDLTLQSTAHATRGTVKIVDVLNSTTERTLLLGAINTVSFFTNVPALEEIGGTITANTTGTPALLISTIFNGSAAHVTGLWVNPVFQPSASATPLRGMFVTPIFDPATGKTIAQARVMEFTGVTGSNGGAITTLVGCEVGGPSLGTVVPTNVTGLQIDNQGVASVTTAIGLQIVAQSGATNNFTMSLPVVAINTGTTVWTAGVPSVNPSGLVKIIDDGGNTRYMPCWA
jgi:hypothetical protein